MIIEEKKSIFRRVFLVFFREHTQDMLLCECRRGKVPESKQPLI